MNSTEKTVNIPAHVALYLFLHTALTVAASYVTLPGISNSRLCLVILSYILPGWLAIYTMRRHGIVPQRPSGNLQAALPLFFILLAAMVFISSLTAWLMNIFGTPVAGGGIGSGGDFLKVLLLDCYLPATLEELFFRYTILTLLLTHCPKNAVWVNALLFALIHPSLYQLPYAFCGGIILALTARIAGPLAALLFHFGNNLASVLLTYGEAWGGGAFNAAALTLIILLAVLSSVLLVRRRREECYAPIAEFFSRRTKEDGSPLRALGFPIGIWCILALLLTLLNTLF